MDLDAYENVIFFDGVCHLCSKSVTFVVNRDRKAVFRYCAIQSDRGREIAKSIGIDPDAPQSLALVRRGKVYTASGAALRIVTGLGGLWPVAGVFLAVPPPLRDLVYRIIAKNRYRWFGKHDSCWLGTEEIRRRSIT